MNTSLSLCAHRIAVKQAGQHALSRVLLHPCVITALIFAGFSSVGRADEENWSFVRNEASLSVTLNAPSGTSNVSNGDQRQVNVTVQRFTWEVWESDLGNTETRGYGGGYRSNASVSFSIGGSSGSLSVTSGLTDGSGAFTTTLTMGSASTEVQASVTDSDGTTTGTASLVFTPPDPNPETFSYVRTESLLSASLTVPGGVTDVAAGQTRQVQMHAQYDSWEVWQSNYGNIETRNPSSAPASYAGFSWTIETGVDGSISGVSAGQTDTNGDASVTFTMGSASSTLRADVSYAGSSSGATSAAATFTPATVQEQWQYDHTEGYISASLTADSGLVDVTSGAQRQITADVQFTSWEIYVSNLGGTEIRNPTAGPAINANLVFSIDSGDGSVSTTTASTGASGTATATFTMGTQNSHLALAASYALGSATASLDFSPPSGGGGGGGDPETWSKESDGGTVSVTASGAGAYVSYATWEVWVSNLGNHENRNPASGTAINAPISCSVTDGDAVVSACDSKTNGGGTASFTVEGGSVESTVTVSASFAGISGSATITVAAADSDGDTYSDAAEYSAGTNPNDRNSKPSGGGGGTTQIKDHDDEWVETVVVEFHNRETCVVTFEDSTGQQSSTSVSVELGAQGKAAVAASLGISEEHVHSITITPGWVETARTSDSSGTHPGDWTPTIPNGWDFDGWIVAPAEDTSPTVTTVTLLDDGAVRRIWTHTVGTWVAQWRIKMK